MTGTAATPAARALAVVRIVVGGWFVKTMFTKLSWTVLGVIPVPLASERWVNFLPTRLAQYAEGNPISWYRDFLVNVAIPHATVFAWLTAFGEAAVGAGLLLGLFTQYAAAVGLVITTSYALATFHVGQAQQGFHLVLAACMAAFIIGHAGFVWGIDGLIRDRRWLRAGTGSLPAGQLAHHLRGKD